MRWERTAKAEKGRVIPAIINASTIKTSARRDSQPFLPLRHWHPSRPAAAGASPRTNKCYASFAEFKAAVLDFLREQVPRDWHRLCDEVTDNFHVIDPENFRVLG
jgi:hypothetical protein